jgi:hypothetical protein
MSLTNSLWQEVVWVEFFWIGVPFGIAVKPVYLDEKGNSNWYRVLSCKMLRRYIRCINIELKRPLKLEEK